ncbi:NAD-dependent epimerase/dehydratase family protein [Deinococcus multiflagellatus]|uniref:NAD-dependent epimerase/dehydratase family protein n=1 Tax=Deinococcus multiflagellatus TaxID=1656887 RepID=A0ABW1ZMT1_9DEIO
MKVMVTGANGFIGQQVVAFLAAQGDEVLAVTREPQSGWPAGVRNLRLADVQCQPEQHFAGVNAVVHLAGRAHQTRVRDQAAEWCRMRAVNVELTRHLAQLTFEHSEARFVLVSSIGVHGVTTAPGKLLSERSALRPSSAYAQSKRAAEAVVEDLALAYGGTFVVVRPPLVFGTGAPANFGLLEKAARLPLPLPFGRATAPGPASEYVIWPRFSGLWPFTRRPATAPTSSRKTRRSPHGPSLNCCARGAAHQRAC